MSLRKIYASHRRKFRFIFYKHILLRKKSWKFLIIETCLPVLFFLLYSVAVFNFDGVRKHFVNTTTTTNVLTTEDIFQKLPYINTQIYYTPVNNFTKNIIRKIRVPLDITADGKCLKHFF